MKHSKSSQRWLREHFNDPYVKRAQQEGYRSRAVYKLLELQQRDRLLRPGQVVVDLGAAPGGWSQVAAELVGTTGKVFALDILPMDPLPGVEVLQGDFQTEEVLDALLKRLAGIPVDLVISDMAPNMSGMSAVDQPRGMYLVELALDFAHQVLKPNGVLLTKCFQGAGFEAYMKALRQSFGQVLIRKPDASRQRSKEVYLLAKGYKGPS